VAGADERCEQGEEVGGEFFGAESDAEILGERLSDNGVVSIIVEIAEAEVTV